MISIKNIFVALLVCASLAAAQQIQISGGVSISGSATTVGTQITQPQPLVVTPAQYPSGVTGTAYSTDITPANGTAPYTCSISVGSLPTGLALSTVGANTNCHIGGTPTVAGTYNFTISATDSAASSGTLAASITITSSLAVTQSTIPSMVVGNTYSPLLAFSATGGTAPYTFSLASGTLPPGCILATPNLNCTPTQAGTFTYTVTVTDSGANTATSAPFTSQVALASAGNRYCAIGNIVQGLGGDGPVATPLAHCLYTGTDGTPANGTVRTTTAANLASTYAAASCGDRIVVTGGTSNTGQITLTSKGCDNNHWIWIMGSGVTGDANFPAEGTRVSPCFANVTSLPNRPAYPCASPASDMGTLIATSSNNAIVLNGADHLRFIGMELTRVTTPGALIYSIVSLQSSPNQAHHIIFDRCWIHGVNADGTFPQTKATDTSTTRGIYLGQSNNVAIIDSYMSDFYDNGATASNGNTDAQCVGGGVGGVPNSGWGIYKFTNNHCEGASEGLILGGSGGPALTPTGCTSGPTGNCNPDVPTDIEVRQNYFFAPNSWNGNTTTINATGWPNRKNGIEFKVGANILLEANWFENCWYSSQPYCYVFDFAPKNQMNSATDPGSCPSCFVKNFVARYNYGYNYPGDMTAIYSTSFVGGCAGCGMTWGANGSIHDNLLGDKLNRGNLTLTGFDGFEFLADAGPMVNISYFHNTTVSGYRSFLLMGSKTNSAGTSGFNNITIQDNIGTFTTASGGGPWFAGNGSTSGTCDLTSQTFATYLSTCVTTNTVDHNGVFNVTNINGWPASNLFLTTTAAVQFVNYGTGDSGKTLGNYALRPSSPWHNAAHDGTDLGANITALTSALSGVNVY